MSNEQKDTMTSISIESQPQEITQQQNFDSNKIVQEQVHKLPPKALSNMFSQSKATNTVSMPTDAPDSLQKQQVSGLLLINTEKQNSKMMRKMKKGFSFSPDAESTKLYHYKNAKAMIDISKDMDAPWAKIIKMIFNGKADDNIDPTDYFDFIENFFQDSILKDTKVHQLVKLLMNKEFVEQLNVQKLQDEFFNKDLPKATSDQLFEKNFMDAVDTSTKSSATTVIPNNKSKSKMNDVENDKYSNGLTSNSEPDETERDYGVIEYNGKMRQYSKMTLAEKRDYKRILRVKYEKENREKLAALNPVVLTGKKKINNEKIDPSVVNENENEKQKERKKKTYALSEVQVTITPKNKQSVSTLTIAKATSDEIDGKEEKPYTTIDAVVYESTPKVTPKPGFSLLDADIDQIDDINKWTYVKPQTITKVQKNKNRKMKAITELSSKFRQAQQSNKMMDANQFRKILNNENEEVKEQQEVVDLLTAPNSLSLTGFPELLKEARQVLHENDAPSFELWKKFKITDTDNKTFNDYIASKSNEDRTSQRIANAKSLCQIMSKAPYHPYVDDTMSYSKIYHVRKEMCNDDHTMAKMSFALDNQKDSLNKKVQLLWSFRYGCRTGLEPESDVLPALEASIYLIPYYKVDGVQNLATTKFPEKIPALIMNNYLSHLLTGNFCQTLITLSPYLKGSTKPFAFKAYNTFTPDDIGKMENTPFKALCLLAGQSVKKHFANDEKTEPDNMVEFQEMYFEICDKLREQLGADVKMLKNVGILSNEMRLEMHKATAAIKGKDNEKIVFMLRDSVAKVLSGDDILEKRLKADKLMPNFIRLSYDQKIEFVNCVINCVKNKDLGNTIYNNCIIDVDPTTNKYKTLCCKEGSTIDDGKLYLSHPCIYHMLADGSGRHKLKDNASEIGTCNSCQSRYKSVIISNLCYLAGLFEKSLKKDHHDMKVQKNHQMISAMLEKAAESMSE